MTYRVLAHIENSEGIYIAAECHLEHSAKIASFLNYAHYYSKYYQESEIKSGTR